MKIDAASIGKEKRRMKHVTALVGNRTFQTGFQDVLVYGKGASFNPEAYKFLTNPLIVSINDAVNKLTHADIVVMNDLNVIEKLTSKSIQATRFFFLPSSVPRRDRHNPEIMSYQATDFWVRNSEKLALMKDKVFYFDSNFLQFDFFNGCPIYSAYHSTYEMIFQILGSNGVKKIYTSGIDYNAEYHGEFRKDHPADLSAMKSHIEQFKRMFGTEEVRL